MNLKNIFNKLKKDKKGLSSIELVFGALISIIIFAGFLDFLIISNRMQAMSTSMTYLSRTLSNQGCLANNPETECLLNGETGYRIDYIKNKTFVNSDELFQRVENIMRNEGISNDEWSVRINGVELSPRIITPVFDFRDRIDIEIRIEYSWTNISNLLFFNLPGGEFTSNQEIVSSYKFRNENSDSGFEYGK